MKYNAKVLAKLFKGTIEGDPKKTVDGVSSLELAGNNELTFVAGRKYLKLLYESKAGIVLIGNNAKLKESVSSTLIRVENPEYCFLRILQEIDKSKKPKKGISKLASIDKSAKIGSNVFIGDFVCIGANSVIEDDVQIESHCSIGDNVHIRSMSHLYHNISVYDDSKIGRNCILHSGIVLGGDGFGFKPDGKGGNIKVPQLGNVVIEDDVEIGSNCTIDRAALGTTYIRKGVKLDNQIQIAHNCDIGENTVIASQTGISGSTKIGRNCMIGGQVGIVDHTFIADQSIIIAQTGIPSSLKEPGKIWSGSPVMEFTHWKRSFIHFRNFDQIVERIEELEKKMNK